MLPLLLEPDVVVDERGHLVPGPVRVERGRIAHLGKDARRAGAVVVPMPGRALFPGFVNAHSHAFQRGLRGVVEKKSIEHAHDDFWTWRTRMYALANALSAHELRAVARAAFSEMLLAGYTTVGEFHYLHRTDETGDACRAVVDAARDVGIGLVLLETGYARAGFGKPPLDAQRRFVFGEVSAFLAHVDDTRRELGAGDDAISVGVAIHSVRACPSSWMRTIAAYAREHALPLHVHASEQRAELAHAEAEHGKSPIAVLDDAGALGPMTCVVHATHVDDDDIARLAARGASVCLCPTTERNLGDGICPTRAFVDAGVPLAIGSDSQTRIDPLAELRAVEDDERLRVMARSVLVEPGGTLAEALVPVGTVQGARALARDSGRLAVGAPADLVGIALPRLDDRGERRDAIDALLVAGDRRAVRDVVVRGAPVMLHGQVVGFDVAAIVDEARDALKRAASRR